MRLTTTEEHPLTGRVVLICLLVAFSVVITVNGVLIAASIASFTGETQPKSYANGLDFNQTLNKVAAQHRRGWKVDSQFENVRPGVAHLTATYLDANSAPLPALTVTAAFARPTQEDHDFEITLKNAGEGHYSADVEFPLAGKWNIRLLAEHDNEPPYILDYKYIAK